MISKSLFKIIVLMSLLTLMSTAVADISNERQKQLDLLLTQDCGSCHGLKRNGGLGPALHASEMKKYSLEALVAVILNGIADTAMPPWGDLLSADDARYLAKELLTPKLITP